MTELPERLRLDLADTLTRDIEFLADFLKRACTAVIQTEPQAEDLLLSLRQRSQHLDELLLQKCEGCGIRRDRNVVILNKVSEMAVLLLTDRRLERDRLLRDLQDLTDTLYGHIHLFRDFLRGRLAAEFLKELSGHTDQLVDRLDHMDRNTDRPRLIRDRSRDRLAEP